MLVMWITSSHLLFRTRVPSPATVPFDSCHSRVIRNQQNLYPRVPTDVAELLQYSGSRVELRDGFSS